MLRKIWIVLGAVALVNVAYVTAFAVEGVQQPVVVDDTAGGVTEATTWTVCSSGCDFTLIQEAVDAAASGDSIQLGTGTFFENLCIRGPGTGLRHLTIRGLGTNATVVDGSGQNLPVFGVNDGRGNCGGSGDVVLLIADMTIQNSAACGIEAAGSGRCNDPGCLRYSSRVAVQNCVVWDNGCGIANGGDSDVSISTTTISGNDNHGFDSRGMYGSGIYASTLSGNGGYGIRMGMGSRVSLSNSTVSGNGAGVGLFSGEITVAISQSTIGGNLGPGLVMETNPAYPSYFDVSGSIVANNLGDNCWTTSGGHNLSSDLCSDAGPTDIIATDPQLLPLADNGGPTPTHALAPGSPAIDAGADDCAEADQRGVARPQDGDADGIPKCDIGAYEFDLPSINIDIKPNGYPNSVNPNARGVVPVAILGNGTFDVADIDEGTLRLGPGAAPIAHRQGHFEDVNTDGFTDLVTHFRTQDTGITCGNESATLTGETLDGQPLEGSDSIQTVGCRETRRPAIWMKDTDRLGKPRSNGPVNVERK